MTSVQRLTRNLRKFDGLVVKVGPRAPDDPEPRGPDASQLKPIDQALGTVDTASSALKPAEHGVPGRHVVGIDVQ